MNIVLTGASYGLGRAIAIALSRKKARFVLLARTSSKLEETRSLMENPDAHKVFKLDLCQKEEISQISQTLADSFPSVDVLINNAAGWNRGSLEEMDEIAIEEQISGTLTGSLLLTKHLLPSIKQSAHPHIINIASTAALHGYSAGSSVAYSASKWGFAGMSASMREELRSDRIKVTTLYPGTFATKAQLNEPSKGSMSTYEVVEAVLFCLSLPPTSYIESLVIQPFT